MIKFNMTDAWNDAMGLLRTDQPLVFIIAGTFLFLPALAFAVIGPVPIETPPTAGIEVQLDALSQYFFAMLPWMLGVSIITSLGAIAIMRLWLAEVGISVGEAIGFAVALLPTLIIVFLIQGVATMIAIFALVLPAIYLNGRLSPVLPLLASGETRSPIDALDAAWTLTRGNGWRVALMLFLIQFVVVILSSLVEGIGGMLGERGSPGALIAGGASALVSTAAALILYAVTSAIYRQLSYRSTVNTFE